MDDFFSFIGFVITAIFFIWFGRTLNAIKANTENALINTRHHSRLLERIAAKIAPEE